MKLVIFGSTGRSGQLLVKQALAVGHEVIAFARTPAKLEVQDEQLSIVQGDVADINSVTEAISRGDVVLSTLGPARGAPAGVMSRGLSNILAAMQENNVRRLIVVVGAGVGDPQDRPRLFDRLIGGLLRLVARPVYDEMKGVADKVRASDVDWTLVRVPMLTDAPSGGDVRVGYLGGDVGSRVSREDLAQFMLAQVTK